MKRFKKILAMVIAMAMVLSMGAMTAFAAGHTITVPSSDTHEYKVYQILTGTLSDDNTTLSDANWGTSVKTITEGKINGKTVAQFMKDMEALSANAAVDEAMKYVDLEKPLSGTVKSGTGMENLAEGYYILVDVTDPLTNTVNGKVVSTDTKALSLLQLLDDVTVTKKWGTTEDKKTIETDTLGKTGTETNTINDDDDNVSIGDTVNYKIEATVPENTDRFAEGTFFFVITDKLSSGLTFTNGSIKVYVKGAGDEGADLELDASKYTVKTNPNCVYDTTNTFEVALKDAGSEAYRGKTIIVKYSATVNENAVIGDAGNPNDSKVKFSNEPDKTYSGEPDDDDDGFPDSINDVPTGETPTSETKTYVAGIEILKVDENGEPLQNAKFEISGTSVKKVVTKDETFEVDDTNGTYYLLKDGTYTMVAPTEENTMVAAQAGATKGYVQDNSATGDGVIDIAGVKYRPVKANETPTHVLKVGSAAAYADNHKYKKTVTKKTVDSDATDQKMEEQVDNNGLVRFDGLGAGEYTIKETQTPNGFNTMEDVKVTITYPTNADISDNTTPKFTVSGGDAKYEDGIIKITIVNHKGSTLPETGGIGTTIFYVVGAILVIGAGVVMITRRRMDA